MLIAVIRCHIIAAPPAAAAMPALVYAECSCDVTSVLLFGEEAPCLQVEDEMDRVLGGSRLIVIEKRWRMKSM